MKKKKSKKGSVKFGKVYKEGNFDYILTFYYHFSN